MEGIGEIWHRLAPLLMQHGSSHVLVIIVTKRVILFLDHIKIKDISGLIPIYSRLLCGNFLPVSFPPMFDMVKRLKECEGDLFPMGKIVNK
jgi:hypothetical protein